MTTTIDAQQEEPTSLRDEETPFPRAHVVIKNYVLEFCQILFSAKADGELNYPGILWDPDLAKTQIYIGDKYSFNLDQVSQNPAIVANRGPLAWQNRGGIAKRQAFDFKTGKETYTDLVRGAVTLSCFAQNGLEAENIAGFVFEAFTAFRNVLRRLTNEGRIRHNMGLFKTEAVTMGEEALVKSDSRPELSVVPVAIAAMAQRRWSTEPRARKLRGVIVRTST